MKFALDNLDMTTMAFTGNSTSAAVNNSQVAALAIQVEIVATGLSGTLKLQGTNIDAGTSWSDITDSAGAVLSVTYTTQTATLNWLCNVNAPAYKYVRLSWTRTAGSGTCTVANISTKAV